MDEREKINKLWSSRYRDFASSPHESGGSYPAQLSEVISTIELCSVMEVVNPTLRFSMLDIGAGGGRWTLAFADKVGSILALEPSDLYNLLRKKAEDLENVTCLQQPFDNFSSETSFDLVLLSGVLLYIVTEMNVEIFLKKAASLVRQNGYLVLREPVARRMKYLIDWNIVSKSAFENRFEDSMYWELIRPENHYTEICESMALKKVTSFVSHAPFFFHLRFPNKKATIFFRHLVQNLFTLRRFKTICLYNRLIRKPYAYIRYVMNLRSMKICVFKRY